MSTKLLFLAGSCRQGSLNMKLAQAAQKMADESCAETTFIDLADYEMPLYNGDIEDKTGAPEAAKKLKKIFKDHDGFFMASPEYNSGYSPLLKNTIDWMTRVADDDTPKMAAFQGKVGAISAASPGELGGLRGLVQLRLLLSNINVHVIPSQAALSSAHESFDDKGIIINDAQAKMVKNMIEQFVQTAKSMKA